jgi:hypothetical protein
LIVYSTILGAAAAIPALASLASEAGLGPAAAGDNLDRIVEVVPI